MFILSPLPPILQVGKLKFRGERGWPRAAGKSISGRVRIRVSTQDSAPFKLKLQNVRNPGSEEVIYDTPVSYTLKK